MKGWIRIWRVCLWGCIVFWSGNYAFAERKVEVHLPEPVVSAEFSEEKLPAKATAAGRDSFPHRFVHRLETEVRPGYIVPTNSFLRGENKVGKILKSSCSVHFKYSFRFSPHTCMDRIYGGAYQGIGGAYYIFGDQEELGRPVAFYLFQGARIVRIADWLSVNYEWNFGLSTGWKPYNYLHNGYNKMIGSELNAYINTNFYLDWKLLPRWNLTTGITLTHFSNGNTRFPNAGMNTVGVKMGLAYCFNKPYAYQGYPDRNFVTPAFPRHLSYDLVLFGSWRRKGVAFNGEQVASPEAYTVLGFNFAPMYNLGYKFRTGISVDGIYDGSANVYTEDYIVGTTQEFYKPSLSRQLALGLSVRAEYVMPYFTIGIGVGANVLHRGGDLGGCYQILALKIETTRSSFLHIGYNLKDFHDPNFLMLGFGFRFHNKYPQLRHRRF